MIIGITIWNNRVSPVFDSAERILLAEIQENRIVFQSEYRLRMYEPVARVEEIKELNLTALITGVMSIPYFEAFKKTDIQLITQIRGDGSINNADFKMIGCRRKQRRKGNCGRRSRKRRN